MEKSNEIRFKKIGGGSLRWGKRIIKPGEVFTADPKSIPATFRNVLIPLDKIPEPGETTKEIISKQVSFEKVAVTRKDIAEAIKNGSLRDDFKIEQGKKYFNVINKETKKPINTIPVEEEKADNLLNDLSK